MIIDSEKNYLQTRRNQLQELQKLMSERSAVNKNIRALQREMNGWDNWLRTNQ